jgi:hypothetical protein
MSELFFGTTGEDTLEITQAGAVVFGGGANDEILGQTTSKPSGSSFYGGGGADIIYVQQGDRAFGGNGDDVIWNIGGKNNQLFGGAGNDSLYGGSGDILVGGSGNDEFIFVDVPDVDNPSSILDFTKGEDAIVVGLLGINSLDDLSLVVSGNDTLINVPVAAGSDIARPLTIVRGETNLTADDFRFEAFLNDDNAGSTVAGAKDLGALSGLTPNTTLEEPNGSFSNFDPADFYKFNLVNLSDITISLTEMGNYSNGDLFLVPESGDFGAAIAASQNAGNQDDIIEFSSLAAGEYYVVVTRVEGFSNYNLNITAENLLIQDGVGDTIANATPITSFATPTTGSVGSIEIDNNGNLLPDNVDMYKVTFATDTIVDIALSGLSAINYADLFLIQDINNNQVFDGEGEVIGSSQNTDGSDQNITKAIPAGDYFVLISNVAGQTNYSLTFDLTPLIDDGAGSDAAFNLGSLTTSPITKAGSFAQAFDKTDVYSFTAAAGTTINLTLAGLDSSNYGDLFLARDIDADGSFDGVDEVIAASQDRDGSDEEISGFTLTDGGQYFIVITNVIGATNYDLTLEIV